jgi:hypothetical protein
MKVWWNFNDIKNKMKEIKFFMFTFLKIEMKIFKKIEN